MSEQIWLDYQHDIGLRHTPTKKNKTEGRLGPVHPAALPARLHSGRDRHRPALPHRRRRLWRGSGPDARGVHQVGDAARRGLEPRLRRRRRPVVAMSALRQPTRGRAVPPTLTADYIAERWPRLFHMAEAGSWPAIAREGLLCTSALLDRFEIEGSERVAIESRRRAEAVEIHHATRGSAWIRDNKPINETVLRRTLSGMDLARWYETLNGRVFFWLTRERLDRLRDARPYRERLHDVLTIDTAALLRSHGEEVELAHLNTGAVHRGANYPRGAGTFRRIGDYPWRERLTVSPREPIVELTVPYAVCDIADLVVSVALE